MIWKHFFLFFCFFAIIVPFSFTVEEDVERIFPPQAVLAAAYRGDVATMREILAENPDRDTRDTFGATALHVAIFQPNLAMVRLLLENGFDPNARATRNGYTPLHNAVAANNADAARLLLQFGADRNIRNLDRLTPYQMAVNENKRPLILVLYR